MILRVGLDLRVTFLIFLILVLAFAATLQARSLRGPALGAITKQVQLEETCAKRQDGQSQVPKECKDLLTLTLEDPVALYTFVLTMATLLLFLATSGLWYMAVRQSKDTRETILVSQDANEIARVSLEIGQRPWLGFEHFGPNEIRLHYNQLRFRMLINVRNYGLSPAPSVHFGCILLQEPSGTNVWESLQHLARGAMRVIETTAANPIIIFPGQERSLERYVSIDFSREEIDQGSKTLFANYYILVSYRHPVTRRAYCTATGYGFIRENCPTYSMQEQAFDTSVWSVHAMPGCNFVA